MITHSYPEEMDYTGDESPLHIVVRGKTLHTNDYNIEFHNNAQAHAFAFVLTHSLHGDIIMAEPKQHAITTTGFACEIPPESIINDDK